MKKTYISPAALTVQLGSRDAMLQSISSTGSLSGTTSSRGGTQSAGIEEADVKGIADVNVWDNEW